jgi:hypothetical protein
MSWSRLKCYKGLLLTGFAHGGDHGAPAQPRSRASAHRLTDEERSVSDAPGRNCAAARDKVRRAHRRRIPGDDSMPDAARC